MVHEVVVVVANHWSKDPRQLPWGNHEILAGELRPDYGLPDVVLQLVDVSDQTAFIAALVALIILNQRDEVCGL
jgi:hypothetical protein